MSRYWSLVAALLGSEVLQVPNVCMSACAYVLCVYKRGRCLAYVHLSALTRTVSLLPPLIPNPSRPLSRPPREQWRSHCFMLCNLHVLTPHEQRSAPPYHTSFMVYGWYRAQPSSSAFDVCLPADCEPSKSLLYVKRETFLFWCSVSFLIPFFKVYLTFS